MKDTPLVSIIVPVFNTEKYLKRCIDSLIRQTYTNIEIILVDDGSTDKSCAICDEYAGKDERIVVLHQENKGVSSARNKGIQASSGKYLTFTDSDDELFPNAIETMVDDAEKYKADIVSTTKITFGTNSEIISKYDNGEIFVFEGTKSLELSLEGNNQTNSSCAKLFLRKFVGDIRFTDGRNINEDGFFLFCCFAKKPRLLQHNIPVYKYFLREDSNSREAFSDKYLDILYFCERKKEIVFKEFPELAEKTRGMEIRANMNLLQLLCRTKDRKYKDLEKKSIKTIKHLKKPFVPKNKAEKRMFLIIINNLFYLYKFLFRIKSCGTF